MKTNSKRLVSIRRILIGSAIVIAGSLSARAAVGDLTTAGSNATINGGFFQQVPSQSTGTGVIDPFVRISDNANVVEGYNATARPVMPQVNTSPTFTHDLQFSAVPQVTNPTGAPAGTYLQFLLDINQTAVNPLLSLHELEIFTRTGPLLVANTYSALSTNAVKRWDLDFGPQGDSLINLNYGLNPGSGAGDMFAYIPLSAFAGVAANDFLYLYSAFGVPNPNNDGFEEWATLRPGPSVPDGGSTIALLGGALLFLAGLARRGILIAGI